MHANAAWVAYRDGDLETAAAEGERAIDAWGTERRAGPTLFQWTARFPLVGVELAWGRLDAAFEQCRALLDPSQQPLPPELLARVEEAIANGDRGVARTRAGGGGCSSGVRVKWSEARW